jgi:ATP-dependent Clp protease ATP-binding subunit ClpB
LAKNELSLLVTDEAKVKLAELGYDPVFGARPLKRVLQKEVADRVARAVLEGRFTRGDQVKVDLDGETIVVGHGMPREATQRGANA